MRIFVYGTLKRGLSNHGHMAGQQFITVARTLPHYRLADCRGYPGMYPVREGGLAIAGEIWEVDERGRAKLDILEDVALGMYALEPVALQPVPDAPTSAGNAEAGETVFTYIYKWPVSGLPDAGDEWREGGKA